MVRPGPRRGAGHGGGAADAQPDHLRVAGEGGTLDGQGQAWWNCWRYTPGPGNLSDAPCSGYSRPHNLFLSNVSEDETVNSARW